MFNNKRIVKGILFLTFLLWILFVSVYFFYNQGQSYINKKMSHAYDKGVEDVTSVLIQKASSCQAFSISFTNETYNLINIDCINGVE